MGIRLLFEGYNHGRSALHTKQKADFKVLSQTPSSESLPPLVPNVGTDMTIDSEFEMLKETVI